MRSRATGFDMRGVAVAERDRLGVRRATKRFIVVVGLAAGVLTGADAASAETTTFTTPGQHTYTVPAGVTRVDVVAAGGAGAANGGAPARRGGLAAKIIATLDVAPGDTLYAVVGTSASGTTPGANGGGEAGGTAAQCPTAPGAGGGASDVRTVPLGQPGSAASRVLVAGGGGGAASFGLDGGTDNEYAQLAGGHRGRGGGSAARGGQGGLNGDPGFGGGGGGADGTASSGGRGAAAVAGEGSGCGGGGGGGYGGGGGGGAATSGGPGGGGGGGGSLVPEDRWAGMAGPGEPPSVTFITPGMPKPAGRLGITTFQTFKQDDQGGGPLPWTNCPSSCRWIDYNEATGNARAPGSSVPETLTSMQGWGSGALIDFYFSQSYAGARPPAAGHPAEIGQPFLLSDFAHLNAPNRGDTPTAVALQTRVRAQPPAGDVVEFKLMGGSSIPLGFLETSNSPPCDPTIQVSETPCDDRWLFDRSHGSLARTTVANGVTWHFEVLGWRTDAGTFTDRFVTRENYVDHRGLYGLITVETNETESVLSIAGQNPARPELRLSTTPVPQTGGTVTFTDGGASIPGCTKVPVGATDGMTTCTPTRLSAGTHLLAASFNGGVGYGPSTASPQTHVVPAPKLALTVKPKKRTTRPAKQVRFSAAVTNSGGGAAERVEICARVPKRARSEVKVTGCKRVGVLVGGGSAKKAFKAKPTGRAHGKYPIRFTAKARNADKVGATAKLKVAR